MPKVDVILKAIRTLSNPTVESYRGGHTEEEGYLDVVKPYSRELSRRTYRRRRLFGRCQILQ